MQGLIVLTEEQLRQVVAEAVKTELKAELSTFSPAPTIQPQKEELITRKEAASFLGVTLPTLNEWTKTGTVKGYRINSRIRYKRSELEQSLTEVGVRDKVGKK